MKLKTKKRGDASEALVAQFLLMSQIYCGIFSISFFNGENLQEYPASLLKVDNKFYWYVTNVLVGAPAGAFGKTYEHDFILVPAIASEEAEVIADGPPKQFMSRAEMAKAQVIVGEVKTKLEPWQTSGRQFLTNLQWSKMGMRILYVSVEETKTELVFTAQRNLATVQGQTSLMWYTPFDDVYNTIAKIGRTIY